MQAPHPAAPDAESLRAFVSAVPSYKDLTAKLDGAARSLSTIEQRRNALREERTRSAAAVKDRETALLVEHAGSLPEEPDPHLSALKLAATAVRDKLEALADEEAKLTVLVAALRSERESRDGRLRQLAQEHCFSQWKGKSSASVAEAREALARAAIAWSSERTERIEFVGVEGFLASVIVPGEVARLIKSMAEAEHERARCALVKKHPELGEF